ncbi:MAG: hypothetical protein ABW167_07640 [Baekduia sp.]
MAVAVGDRFRACPACGMPWMESWPDLVITADMDGASILCCDSVFRLKGFPLPCVVAAGGRW